MDGHAPPSYSGPTQYQTPSGSSRPPIPPCHQTPQPFQNGSQNFIPSPSSPSWWNKEMACPPLPMHNSSFAGGSGGGIPASVLPRPPLRPSSSAVRYSPPSPAIPYSTGAGSSLPPRNAEHDIISKLNSLLARNNPSRGTNPKPIEMPVGVRSQKKSVGEEPPSHDDVNVGNKRRAGNEIAPRSKIRRSVSRDGSLNGKSSVHDDAPPPTPPPPPQGVSVDVGNDNAAYGGGFNADQLTKIGAKDLHKQKAESDPKSLKRLLSNRESAARSKLKKELYLSFVEDKVVTLESHIDTLTAEINLEKREKMVVDGECAQLKILLEGGEKQAQLYKALNKQLTGKVHRLTGELSRVTEEASREREEMNRLKEEMNRLKEENNRLNEEVNEYRRRESESLDANILELLNIDQQFQEQPDFNFEW